MVLFSCPATFISPWLLLAISKEWSWKCQP
uniref:Uncharacterized protein n=1 Tax=Anguilla anguilla TaxID=7936 RepID=A0A0E9VBS5_ANGAN